MDDSPNAKHQPHLEAFTKPNASTDNVRTTVNIRRSHMSYVQAKRLNLSALVRDLIERLIKST